MCIKWKGFFYNVSIMVANLHLRTPHVQKNWMMEWACDLIDFVCVAHYNML